jgi:hypothetical protein
MPVIPALGKVRQEDHKLEVSLDYITISRPAWDYIMKPCLTNKSHIPEDSSKMLF